MILLQPKYSIPIEREFEGWVVNKIEQYFQNIDLKCLVLANSPMNETKYPSDEILSFNGKLIGLQFKMPHTCSILKNEASDLFWKLSQRKGKQFNTIKKISAIYYCLPTFINREIKLESLHHCIFWRPNDYQKKASNYWYDNPKAKSNNGKIDFEGMRWGKFVETILSCKIGKVMQKGSSVKEEIKQIQNDYELKSEEGLYFVIMQHIK